MQGQQPRYVFSYAYRPLMQTAPGGGFSVNLASNGLLEYATYDEYRQVTGVYHYMLPVEAVVRYTRMVDYAQPWLRHVPPMMTTGDEPVSEYSFVFQGRHLFRMEDMIQLVDSCHFRSMRGHYARLVYCLFEDITSMLSCYGVYLYPNSFSSHLQPIPYPAQSAAWQTGSQVAGWR